MIIPWNEPPNFEIDIFVLFDEEQKEFQHWDNEVEFN